MEVKYLKFANKTHVDFTGYIGATLFKNGVSVNLLPRRERDRMAAAMQFLEVDVDGNESPAGSAHRLVAEAAARAPVAALPIRQSDEEKSNEVISLSPNVANVPTIHTYEELLAVADKSGISGIREIAVDWNVKHRALVVLIQMILDAQSEWLSKDDNKRAAKQAQEVATQEANSPRIDLETAAKLMAAMAEPVDLETEVENEDILAAAASGDMSAALVEPVIELVEDEPVPEQAPVVAPEYAAGENDPRLIVKAE
jgi:hypothetical protein